MFGHVHVLHKGAYLMAKRQLSGRLLALRKLYITIGQLLGDYEFDALHERPWRLERIAMKLQKSIIDGLNTNIR